MKKFPLLIIIGFNLVLAGCDDGTREPLRVFCPEYAGNFVELQGANFDTVYRELLILPSGQVVNGTPKFFPDRKLCETCRLETMEWSLPLDLSYDTTTYILKGSNRIDTITFTYSRELIKDSHCGIYVLARNLNIHTAIPYNLVYHDTAFYNSVDTLTGVWRIWLDM